MFYFHPYLGEVSNLTNIFQICWNHQLDKERVGHQFKAHKPLQNTLWVSFGALRTKKRLFNSIHVLPKKKSCPKERLNPFQNRGDWLFCAAKIDRSCFFRSSKRSKTAFVCLIGWFLFGFPPWDSSSSILFKNHHLGYIIFSRWFKVPFLYPNVGGHLTFKRVTFSPFQKGHQQNC